MKKIVFIGCGAVTAEVVSYIRQNSLNKNEEEYAIHGVLDDFEDNYKNNSVKYKLNVPYLGEITKHTFSPEFYYVFGFSSPAGKQKILSGLNINNLNFPNILHPSLIIDESAKMGMGNVIYPHCIIGPGAEIGSFNLITSYSFISHDCNVGNSNFFSTTGLSGNVKVGDYNFFGIRSTVIPMVEIGSHNTIQAGMTIDKNVSDNETVFYRFKEKVTIIKS